MLKIFILCKKFRTIHIFWYFLRKCPLGRWFDPGWPQNHVFAHIFFFKLAKWKIFRRSWKSGKFSDLSEIFPQLQIFQLFNFGRNLPIFFQIGKFSTFCKYLNSSDFSGKISIFSIRSENWHTFRPGSMEFCNYRKNWKTVKFSNLSEKFPLLQIFQFIKFWKKICRFFQIGKFSTF